MSKNYFVKYKGRLQGPFSVAQLKTLMKRGKLTRAHLVSEDRKTWEALGEIRGIAEETPVAQAPTAEAVSTPEPTSVQNQPPHPEHPPANLNQPDSAQQYSTTGDQTFLTPSSALELLSKRFMGWTMTCGIVLAAMIILPVSIITFGDESRILWSWSGWEGYSATTKFLFIYTILCSAGLIAISVTTKGLPRAVTTLSIVFVACTLLLSEDGDIEEAILRVALMAIPCAILAATFQWRNLGPTVTRRVMTCVFGGITAVICVSFAIEMLIDIDLDALDGAPSEVTSFTVFAIIMSIIGLGLGIACGVLGILQVKPEATRSSANIGLIFSRIAPVCILLGFLILIIGIGMLLAYETSEGGFMGAFTLFTVRMVVAPLALLVLIECGTYELMLVCSSFMSSRGSPPDHGSHNSPQIEQQHFPTSH